MMVSYDVKRVSKGTESFMVSFDFAKTPITQIADYIIIAASKHNASDIHFDPREDGMMVRFRIDGDCQDYTYVPKAYERNLATRLKLLANMNITETRLPQDGAIKGNFGDTYLDMRVSALPVNEGEKIVIRILDYTRSLEGISTLGFHPKNLEKIKRMMEIPNGIILTTGATGSGKSTTNYSILQGLNKPEVNIITVEDPIEMNIEGINQVQVNAEIGMTFAAALRSILRQDPNIILIGEIRDSETAQIAVRASITGHLVLSTIHTNNSLATIERLLDMDVERYLLSTALTGIISQRLAKMLCPDCRYQRETTKYEKKVFKKYLHKDVATIWEANPKGCEHCRNGYHGRIAIHEVLELDDDIRNALNNEHLEKKQLAKMVYTGKTITMLQDALIKALEGKTTFEEVYRVIEIENEDDENYEQEIAEIAPPPAVEEEVQVSDDLLEIPVDTENNLEQQVAQMQVKAPVPQNSQPTATTQGQINLKQDRPSPVANAKSSVPTQQPIVMAKQPNAVANVGTAVTQIKTVQNQVKAPVQGQSQGTPKAQPQPQTNQKVSPTVTPATSKESMLRSVLPAQPVVKAPYQQGQPQPNTNGTANSGAPAQTVANNQKPAEVPVKEALKEQVQVLPNQTKIMEPEKIENIEVELSKKDEDIIKNAQVMVRDIIKKPELENADKPLVPQVDMKSNEDKNKDSAKKDENNKEKENLKNTIPIPKVPSNFEQEKI